jgi:hypothetical protein
MVPASTTVPEAIAMPILPSISPCAALLTNPPPPSETPANASPPMMVPWLVSVQSLLAYVHVTETLSFLCPWMTCARNGAPMPGPAKLQT